MDINKNIFKAYDIRGVYPEEIDEKAAFLIGEACAEKFKIGVFVLAYDTRLSSKKLSAGFKNGLNSGSELSRKKFILKDVGLATTPMFYFLVNKLKASGGAMATASHNPKEYGGFKIVGPRAEAVSGKEIGRLVELSVTKK